jgi:hypothetical protein
MMHRRELLITAVTGVATAALPIGWAGANHVRIEGSPQPPAPPSAPPAASQTLHADQITALQVRADTIYANKIEADNIMGQIHQTKDVKVGQDPWPHQGARSDRVGHLRRRDLGEFRGRSERLRSQSAASVIRR